MRRHRMSAVITAVAILSCAGCGEDGPARGAEAVADSCEGILDRATIKEAGKNEKFSRTFDATASDESHASAAKTILTEDHAAYVCRLTVADAAETGDDALWIKFTPNLGPLFSEGENHSRGYFKAYKLGPGVQASIASASTDVHFPCSQTDNGNRFSVRGTLYNDLDLSHEARFRVIFRSASKMIQLLKCENEIEFPSPDSVKPLPDKN